MVVISVTILMLTSCSISGSFWEIFKVNLKRTQHISAIQNIGNDTIFFAGAVTKEGTFNTKDSDPYLYMSFDAGENWIEKSDFSCNTIEHLYYNANILLLSGFRYLGDPTLALESTTVFYKYSILENLWQELKLPEGKVGRMVQIVDENTYLINITRNQFGNTYLKTADGGNTWEEHSVLMKNRRDMFEEKCFQRNNIWGIVTHSADSKSIVSINMMTWQSENEIPLPIGEEVLEIKQFNEEIYLLTQANQTCYIKKLDSKKDTFTILSTFLLSGEENASHLFLYRDYQIIVTIDMKSFLPDYKLLYKLQNEKQWKKESFPELTHPCMSFNNGKLIGVAQEYNIYSKQF